MSQDYQCEAVLDVGYVNVEEDFTSCIVKQENGKQDIKKTIAKYIKLLTHSVNVLTLVKDSIDDDELDDIELVADFDSLSLKGNLEIIDRFVGFGIANQKDDDDFDLYNNSDEESYEDSDESSGTEEELVEDSDN
jgi:hypothetical protein